MGGHVVQLVDGGHSGRPAAPTVCSGQASCAYQAPHALLLAPQPRRPVQTATSPVMTATASESGGSVMARRTVQTAPTSRRPRAVSPAPGLGGGAWLWASVSLLGLAGGEAGGSGEVICLPQPRTHFALNTHELRCF